MSNLSKSKIKKFAIEARTSLMRDVSLKLDALNLTDLSELPVKMQNNIQVKDVEFSEGVKKTQRERLANRLSLIGKDQLVEEIAYTWFNRLIALRFMEVNGYIDTGVRVLSNPSKDISEPEIISKALSVNLTVDKEKIYNFQDNNDHEGLFKYLFITQCNDLNKDLPFLFEKIGDENILLLPDHLLNTSSVIHKLVTDIPEEDWKEVEIIGWLYQYYVSERKDKLIKAKKKYKTNDIPPVTQLFTPKWIVKYMVENSLGRYWIESHPEHKADLVKNWEFFIENRDEKSKELIKELENKDLKIEDIKIYDPATGSGHILVYAFELLFKIYQKLGYTKSEIAKSILQNNLFGLDIDNRATQLAKFALLMKGRNVDEKIFSKQIIPNIYEIKNGNDITNEEIEELGGHNAKDVETIRKFIVEFKDAKDLGSIIRLGEYDIELLQNALEKVKNSNKLFTAYTFDNFKPLVDQYRVMSEKYDITVANPPYMGGKYMNPVLSKYAKDYYPDTKSDLFAMFIEMMFERTKSIGHIGLMSPFVWMFIKSYELLRKDIISNRSISTLIQLEYSGFEGATVPIGTYTFRNRCSDIDGEYIKLSDFTGSENQPIKTLEAVSNPNVYYRYTSSTKDFSQIPGSPIAYSLPERMNTIFGNGAFNNKVVVGLQTGNTKKFLRLWTEVSSEDTQIWFKIDKGGEFRKWYGNQEYLVNWAKNGKEIKEYKDSSGKQLSRPQNTRYYFKDRISTNLITSGKPSFRFFGDQFIFDVSALSIVDFDSSNYLLGYLNSKIIEIVIKGVNPTLNLSPSSLIQIPRLFINDNNKVPCDRKVNSCLHISKLEWDSRETSWDFEKNPLIKHKTSSNCISDAYGEFKKYWLEQFFTLHQNEEELNKIFIEIYGLSEEMNPDVELKDITLLKDECIIDEKYLAEIKKREGIEEIKGNVSNPKLKDGLHVYFSDEDKEKLLQFNDDFILKQFVSYAVGCMMGRYSIDTKGLAYAGGDYDKSKYSSFIPDDDAILPVLEDTYFQDDIVTRFEEFLISSFGKETLQQNLDFVASAIGKKGNEIALDTIRRYMFKDFYKDHVQKYKKKPIYWMFSSGKENAFNALVYLHRYNKNTVARLRTEYLHKLQGKYEGELNNLEQQQSNAKTDKAKKLLIKKLEELRKYDELLRDIADKEIHLDLDDGVDVNYEKLKSILAKR